jgi:DNA-binding beta-propeller fold protein YncE
MCVVVGGCYCVVYSNHHRAHVPLSRAGIDVDVNSQTVYFAEAGKNRIQRMGYDGSGLSTVATFTGQIPTDVTFNPDGGVLYAVVAGTGAAAGALVVRTP